MASGIRSAGPPFVRKRFQPCSHFARASCTRHERSRRSSGAVPVAMTVHTALAVAAALVAAGLSPVHLRALAGPPPAPRAGVERGPGAVRLAASAPAGRRRLGWNGVAFRLFYLFGAIVNVPFLALGTVYLLAGRRQGDRWAAVVGLFTAFAAGRDRHRPLHGPSPPSPGPGLRGLRPAAPRAGGGGRRGAARWWCSAAPSGARGLGARRRAAAAGGANVLIAARHRSSSAPAACSTPCSTHMTRFAVTLVVGITVLFAGFLVASGPPRRRPALRSSGGAVTIERPPAANAQLQTFPASPCGSSSTKITLVGHL